MRHQHSTQPPQPMLVKRILTHQDKEKTGQLRRTHHYPTTLLKEDKKQIVYLSFDVETSGPVPGLYSLLSIGFAAFTMDKKIVWEKEINFLPLEDSIEHRKTMEFWHDEAQQEAWQHLQKDRQNPKDAFVQLAVDIRELKKKYRVFPVSWPACFDWMFLHWYMYKFVGENPLGRKSQCAASYAWAIAKTQNPNVDIAPLLDHWEDDQYKHTHKALDDAKEQGARFINMINEAIKDGKDVRLILNRKKK